MERTYVALDDITNFIKGRNTALEIQRERAINRQEQSEARFRQMEIKYIMEELPNVVEPSIVFAEVEDGDD